MDDSSKSASAHTVAMKGDDAKVNEEKRLRRLSTDQWDEIKSENRKSSRLTDEEERRLMVMVVKELLRSKDRAAAAREEKKIYMVPAGILPAVDVGKGRMSFKSAVRFATSFDVKDTSYVRRPKLADLIKTKRFSRFKNRFANSQVERGLRHPTLPQPKAQVSEELQEDDKTQVGEMQRTRPSHRFVVCADTQFGILMDGIAMANPNWNKEIELSRRAVKKINAMKPKPLFVCVCGDLVDTNSSFCSAMPSWKKVMADWEHDAVQDQQNLDFKEVWSELDDSIALVCLCGNHDVGNRPSAASINVFRSAFGDDYLSFWANGTYNIALNNCLFFDPSNAPDLFEEQLRWLKDRLAYATEHGASQIFVFGHFPWFLYHEDEANEDVLSASRPPDDWGPPGAAFSDSYFNIPRTNRNIALSLFREHGVTACFSGHFHQNLCSKTSWGMDMIITGPLSMVLKSDGKPISDEPDENGMRIVDVGDSTFTHKFVPL